MKDVIVLFAKVSAIAFLSCVGLVFAFSVGYKNGFLHGKADRVQTDYGRLEYALDVHPETWVDDLPSVKDMADWPSRTNAPASGGWKSVGCKEAAP